MKNLTWIFAALLSVSLVYSFMNAQATVNQTSSKYIIFSYGQGAFILNYGDKEVRLEPTKEEAKLTSQYAVKVLNKLDSEGYELVSTTQGPYSIMCYLKKVN